MSFLFRDTEQRAITGDMGWWGRGESGPNDSVRYTGMAAISDAAVIASVGWRAGVFAQLPFKSYRDGAGGMSVLTATQPPLLVRPSATAVPSVWRIQMSISRDIWGYALGVVAARDGAGYPTQVEWIPPWEIEVERNSITGPLEWRVAGQVRSNVDLLHVPSRWVLPGCPQGMAPLEKSGLVELSARARQFGQDWFRNGTVPSLVIYSDEQLTEAQADSLSAHVMQKWRRRKPAILGAGLKVEAMSVESDKSQMLETIRQVRTDIAGVFGVPPEKVGGTVGGTSLTYSNRDQDNQQALLDSINPDLVVIQDVLTLALPRPQYVIANTGAFLRSDLKTRYEAHSIAIAAGFMTVDEARALENLGPLPKSDAPIDPADDEPRMALTVNVDARQEPPVVNVEPSVINVDARQEPTVVNVTTPEVVVNMPDIDIDARQEPAVVNVTVEPAAPVEQRATRKTIEHTADGRIAAIIEEPV